LTSKPEQIDGNLESTKKFPVFPGLIVTFGNRVSTL